MDQPIISVVVPLYNCEKFIERLAKSLLPQLSKEVELILIDDGSQDKTPELCDELANHNAYVSVIHKTNGGPSSARNEGIAVAKGEYIAFVDGDDVMEAGSYGSILSVIKQYYPDMIDFGWKYISRNGDSTKHQHLLPKNVVLDRTFIKEVVIPPLISINDEKKDHIYPFSCTKVFKKSIIKNNNIYFDETRKIWEDQPFIVTYLKYSNTFFSMDECLYWYMDTPGSLSRTYTTDFFSVIISNYQLYKELYVDDYDFETQYVYEYWCNAIVEMVFRSFEEVDKKEEIERVIKETFSNPQVVDWFKKVTFNDKLKKNIATKIVTGDINCALILLRRQYRKKQSREKLKGRRDTLKRLVKKLLGKGA